MKRHRFSFWRSFAFAWSGICLHSRTDRNGAIQFAITGGVLAAAAWLRVERWEWCALLLAIGLVTAMETMNTAVERLVDMISPEWHESAGKVKDVAAGAVLLSAVAAAAVGAVVFWPRIF